MPWQVQIILCALVLVLNSIKLSAGEVVAVSPGELDQSSTVAQPCPTFSWSQVPGATRYELAVFEQIEPENRTYEESLSLDNPVISRILPAPALSWTPSSEACLIHGASYIWYVRALPEQQSGWSKGKRFVLDLTPAESALEDAIIDALVSYLSDERTLRRVVDLLQKEAKTSHIYSNISANRGTTATSNRSPDKNPNSVTGAGKPAAPSIQAITGAVKLSPAGDSYFTGGNLGIGTTNPNHKLDVGGDIFVRGTDGYDAPGEDAIAHFGHPAHNIRGEYGTGIVISAYNASDALTVREITGNVGIGTTNPNYKLDVKGDFFVRGTQDFNADGEEAVAYFGASGHSIRGEHGTGILVSAHGAADALTIREGSGYVGIGTTAPIQKLDVAGKIKIGVDTNQYTSTTITHYPVEAFPIISGGPTCDEASRGSMFVGTVSVKPGEDQLCMCLRRGSDLGWYCFGP